MQPNGSTAPRTARALRNATWLALAVAGCAKGGGTPEAPVDAKDARPHDAPVGPVDAAPDAASGSDSAVTCAISNHPAPTLDGSGDLAKYSATQQITPGALLGSDGAAVAWDANALYVTVTSNAFTAPFEPLHIYVEAATALSAATTTQGKEYGGLVPALPFAPTHLIGLRRQSDAGTGPYNSVFLPDATWMTREQPLVAGTDTFVSSDQRTLSVVVPWTALGGCPTSLRLAMHVVHGAAANEWKDLVPTTHTPWLTPGGGYYEIDLTGAPDVTSWTLR
jgi:hypothetical protein